MHGENTFVPVMKAETSVAAFLQPLLTKLSLGGCGAVEYRV
jgi:hypothetical protein